MTIGLLLTAFGLGLRHGVDWDHVAAIADLSSSAKDRRRGFALSVFYALGHGVVVLAIGVVAVLLGLTLPGGVDRWMGRVVGLTFVGMGLWIVIDLARRGRDFRLRSRWILVLDGTFAGLRRVRRAGAARRVVIEHDHEHEHQHPSRVDQPQAVTTRLPGHDDAHAHTDLSAMPDAYLHPDLSAIPDDYAHANADGDLGPLAPASALVAATDVGSRDPDNRHRHRHRHQHELLLADGRSGAPGNGVAAGVGVLHGIGVESPTQIAVFVASTSVVGAAPGFALLAVWVLGLIAANSALAAIAAAGLLHAERNFEIYATVAAVVAVLSVAMGAVLIVGL